MTFKTGLYLVIALFAIGGAGGLYYKIYHAGEVNVERKAEEHLNTVKEKTNVAKTEALTATPDDVDKRLREQFSRPDER